MQQDNLLAWELESASEYSPCPVTDEEILYRQILSPIHYDEETNTFTTAAFSDASSLGMSVNRIKYTSEDHISRMAINRVEQHNESNPNKQRSFSGTVCFVCGDIRQITVQNEDDVKPLRGFCVYDTALEHDQSHADICEIVKKKSHTRSIRLSIRDLANVFLEQMTKPA